jgi:hypothetical protein
MSLLIPIPPQITFGLAHSTWTRPWAAHFKIVKDSSLQTMHSLANSSWWTSTLLFAAQFVVFLRWLYRRIRNDEVTRTFVQDIATNHLPHIYELLQRLCRQQGIDGTNPPIVRWIDLNEPKG